MLVRVREAGWVTAPRLSVGVLKADLTRLGMELEILRGKTAWAHVDVIDGRFCLQVAGWGPDVMVSGSAIFDHRSPARNLELMTRAVSP
jgi:pentose-5-phosphate-3-epimerase